MSAILLPALDGANPLGFLAAVGVLRLTVETWPGVRMRWVVQGGWRPEFILPAEVSGAQLAEAIASSVSFPAEQLKQLGKNITVSPGVFREFARKVRADTKAGQRVAADYAAALGCECCVDEKGDRIQYTKFCFITGSGHQDFLVTLEALATKATTAEIHSAIFGPWSYRDGFSLRWDPLDAREYALRWSNPGPEGVQAVWGANRLAFEALALFPTQPHEELGTTGFRGRNRNRKWDEFTWPIWTATIGADSVRSLLALKHLQEDKPDRAMLGAMGIEEVFRCQRVRIGQGANFKVSFRPSRSV